MTVIREYGPPLRVAGDPQKLGEAFSELMVNARRAMPGGGQLTVGYRSIDGQLAAVHFADTGKGIAAALLMANLQANLRSQFATALEQPGRFLRSVNQLFYENTSDSAYATLFFAEYDNASRRLRYANCGHHSALLLRPGFLDPAPHELGQTPVLLRNLCIDRRDVLWPMHGFARDR